MTREDYRRALKGRRCYVGLDLSSTKDLTAAVAVFPDEDGFDVLAQFFVPQDSIRERSTRDRVPYDQWTREGWLIATPGNQVDQDMVRQTMNEWAVEFELRTIGFDPWNAVKLMRELKELDGFDCVPYRQTIAGLGAGTKSLEKAILSKSLRHDGHPVLRWNISNVTVETDGAGNLKPSKKISTERIDGVVALIMAIDLMDRNAGVDEPKFQVYFLGGGA